MPATDAGTAPVLEVSGLSKRFDMTQALAGVSLALHPGEIHALVGENGAGKSTLIKILTGVEQSDAGEVRVEGRTVHLANAQEAQACGLAAIYQEPLVFPDLDVAENIFITHREQALVVNWKRMYAQAEDLLASLGVRLDVRAPARGLTLAAQQAVEIAKAISLDVRVLIMDEPTASLSDHEVRQLFRVTRQLRDRGVAVLFITHRLEEVFEVADRITVLRDGEHISTRPAAEVTRDLLIRDMVGREVGEFYGMGTERTIGRQVCRVQGLARDGVFSGIDFALHEGEVLGFAGLVGSRRTDVALALFGIQPADRGTIEIDGREVRIASPRAAQQLGIAYMTEDRRKLGLAMPLSIAANVTLPALRRYLSRLGLVVRSREEAAAEGFRQRLEIKAPSALHVVGKLSGGNQQKVMFGKWLNTRPRIFLLDEPTRGIDVGAKAEVHAMVRELAEEGTGDPVHLLRSAGGARHERPRARHARRKADGHPRPGGSDPGGGDVPRDRRGGRVRRGRWHGADGPVRLRAETRREGVLLLLIVLVLVGFSFIIENYLTARLFNRVSASVAILAILAIGQTLVVLTRNIDLSVGSIVGFTAYFVGPAALARQRHPPVGGGADGGRPRRRARGLQRRARGVLPGARDHRHPRHPGPLSHDPRRVLRCADHPHRQPAPVADRPPAAQRGELRAAAPAGGGGRDAWG